MINEGCDLNHLQVLFLLSSPLYRDTKYKPGWVQIGIFVMLASLAVRLGLTLLPKIIPGLDTLIFRLEVEVNLLRMDTTQERSSGHSCGKWYIEERSWQVRNWYQISNYSDCWLGSQHEISLVNHSGHIFECTWKKS